MKRVFIDTSKVYLRLHQVDNEKSDTKSLLGVVFVEEKAG